MTNKFYIKQFYTKWKVSCYEDTNLEAVLVGALFYNDEIIITPDYKEYSDEITKMLNEYSREGKLKELLK